MWLDAYDMGVSICIPTYRRHDMLKECIVSCFANKTRPMEIVVSDDDCDPSVHAMVASMEVPEGISITYVPNRFGKGQAANVNCAFKTARHSRLVMIHDDDYFLPGGIDALVHGWEDAGGNVDAVYGLQRIVDATGKELPKATRSNAESYHRLGPFGRQPSPLRSALLQQFPNNAYMVRRDLALAVGYPGEDEVGRVPVDFHFGLRVALSSRLGFWLIPNHVAAYRLSQNSILRSRVKNGHSGGELGFEALLRARAKATHELDAFEHALNRHAAAAVEGYLAQRNPGSAARVLGQCRNMPISFAGRCRLQAAVLLMRWGLPRLSDRILR